MNNRFRKYFINNRFFSLAKIGVMDFPTIGAATV